MGGDLGGLVGGLGSRVGVPGGLITPAAAAVGSPREPPLPPLLDNSGVSLEQLVLGGVLVHWPLLTGLGDLVAKQLSGLALSVLCLSLQRFALALVPDSFIGSGKVLQLQDLEFEVCVRLTDPETLRRGEQEQGQEPPHILKNNTFQK